MNVLQTKLEPYSKIVVRLLKGDMDYNDKLWNDLLHYELDIHEYVNKIGLELIINRDDQYALLRQFEIDDNGSTIGLKIRTPIGFETSVVCILLREILDEFESNPTKVTVNEKFISHKELTEYVELFLKEQRNRKRFLTDLDKYIKATVDLGFLERQDKASDKITDNTVYQIKKIIKEKISIDQLNDFKNQLTENV